jgi:DNA-binding SARP family transcriptional activator
MQRRMHGVIGGTAGVLKKPAAMERSAFTELSNLYRRILGGPGIGGPVTDSPPQPPQAGQDGDTGAPTHRLSFSLLGRVEILRDGRPVDLRGRKPKAVLAMLLLQPNRVVSCERLMEGLWGDTPPRSATNTLQAFVSRLRAALGENGSAGNGGVLETAPGGYLLRIDPNQVDVHRFEALIERGAAAYGQANHAAARALLDEALGLWKGDPFLGITGEPFAAVEAPRIEELRATATELRLAALLELGEAVAVVAGLEHLVGGDPTRERPTELLMLALYRAGRQGDALAAFDAHRRELVERTGLEPGPHLRALQRRILTHDPALAAAPRPDAAVENEALGMRGRRRAVAGVGLAAAAVATAVLGWIAVGAFHGSGRSSEEVTLAHEVQSQRRVLDRTRSQLRDSQRREQWLRTRYTNQLRMELRALHWIEFDENTYRTDGARVRNDEAAVNAVALVGTPYTWGGARPASGFDCSGLVKWAYGRQGVVLPHNAAMQYSVLSHVDGAVGMQGRINPDHLAIGDLIFFNGLSHVAMYIGRGYVVDALHTGTLVQILRVERLRAMDGPAYGAARFVA